MRWSFSDLHEEAAGRAPSVATAPPTEGSKSAADLVTIIARIVDRGKSVGRIEWRVSGIASAAAVAKPTDSGPAYTVTRQLALEGLGGHLICSKVRVAPALDERAIGEDLHELVRKIVAEIPTLAAAHADADPLPRQVGELRDTSTGSLVWVRTSMATLPSNRRFTP
jgi:hypothetical protein